jgi:hypothetical protein
MGLHCFVKGFHMVSQYSKLVLLVVYSTEDLE